METKTGIIITMKNEKGYGFIRPDEGGVDIFFHAKGVLAPKFDQLTIGERVEYLEEEVPKGKQAVDIAAM